MGLAGSRLPPFTCAAESWGRQAAAGLRSGGGQRRAPWGASPHLSGARPPLPGAPAGGRR